MVDFLITSRVLHTVTKELYNVFKDCTCTKVMKKTWEPGLELKSLTHSVKSEVLKAYESN